ncbi:unnamed protein product [Spirodela intermedia]|uniref:DUF7648 domain-containing protein n=1 Tax=Spirodela intermedia TaxID=51605 RepID=A0A7I8JTR1_SPIIN|nr:unnamed protein product [Spirodela intermedia]CAA6673479.1 unnamed protein product [Spirodela intermedia]
MVNCDVCGVWVHTRCSRFVKGEVSFACDKCKGRKRQHTSSVSPAAENNGNLYSCNGGIGGITNTEETEVAQLLAELPTKTDHCPPSASHQRVHIQGVPGGDPALFQGLSSVFTSELWKCTGYVAKKFNFKYREFPCWEDEEEGENPTSRGADLLFSLSKDITPRGPKDRKGPGSDAVIGGRLQTSAKKERSRIREAGVNSGKRKESTGGKDQSGKKKSRSSGDKSAVDNRKKDRKDVMPLEARSGNCHEVHVNNPKMKHMLAAKTCDDDSANEVPLQKHRMELPVKPETCDEHDSSKTEISPKLNISIVRSGKASGPVKEEIQDFTTCVSGQRTTNKESDNLGETDEDSSTGSLKSEKPTLVSGDFRSSSSLSLGAAVKYSNAPIFQNSTRIKFEAETMGQDGVGSDQLECPSLIVTDERLDHSELLCAQSEKTPGCSRENSKISGAAKDSLSCDEKLMDGEMELGVKHLTEDNFSEGVEFRTRGIEQSVREKVKPVDQLSAGECSSQSIHTLKHEERVKSVCVSSSYSASAEAKPLPAVGKSSAASSTQNFSKSSVSGCKSPGSTTSSTAEKAMTKERMKVNTNTVHKNDLMTAIPGEEITKEATKQLTRNHSKASTSCRSSQSAKHGSTESKEKRHSLSSSMASRLEKTALNHGDAISFPQTRSDSNQTKLIASDSCQKREKITLPISHQSSSTFNSSTVIHPPSVNASTLSDEELARLLHQELNSSPRVPRVPRMRQPDGFHSASGATTSMLSKCSGGKDQSQASRRKNKEDSCRDSSRSSYGLSGETKKADRFPSPDVRKEDAATPANASARRGGQIVPNGASSSAKKSTQLSSTTGASMHSSSSAKANDQSILSMGGSSKTLSPDSAASQAHTLPGTCSSLIDEIMSKGNCVTYEELCSAVLPHWKNLRKPNGDKYAYSSHSQAVLDCLRNRSQWAHLIDRGPKRRGRESPKDAEDKDGDSHPDDFPKGRRKARKRRRLVLRGRVLRNRQKPAAAGGSDGDDALRSSSSSSGDEARSFSTDEDEPEGRRPHPSRKHEMNSSSSVDSD